MSILTSNRRTIDVFSHLDKQILAEKCKRSFRTFISHAWPVADPGSKYVSAWHVDCIADHLQAITEGQLRKLVICIPPGHGKSLICSVLWPAWQWVVRPTEQALYGSYDPRLAERDSLRSRELIESEWYQTLFDPTWAIDKAQRAKGFYKNTVNGHRFSFGMNSRFKTGWRGSGVCVDDPLSTEDRYNTNIKLSIVDTWERTLQTRVNNLEYAWFMLIMQRLSDDDLAGHLIKQRDSFGFKMYEQLIIPSRFEKKKRFHTSLGKDPRKKEGDLLFPALFPPAKLDELENITLGPSDFAAQHQHRPVLEGGEKFQKAWFRYYYYPDPNNNRVIMLMLPNGTEKLVRLDFAWFCASMDVANSIKKEADYTVIGEWAVTQENELVLMNRFKAKMEGPELVKQCKQMHSRMWPNNKHHFIWYVESNGLGLPNAQAMSAAGIPVLDVQVFNDKLVESTTARVRYETGYIYHPQASAADWLDDYENNLTIFPKGGHDDDVSMVSLIANGVYNSSIAQITGSEVQEKKRETAADRMNRFSARHTDKSKYKVC